MRVFQIQQQIARIATTMTVKVIAVHASGVGPTGTVDVQPLVNQIDGRGQATPHGIIFGVPYCRIQGGENAVIIDPGVGDNGLVGFCSRDISSVKATRAQANPGSRRQFDWADAIYIGGMLNGTPTNYIAFSPGVITIHSPTKVRIEAPLVEATGDLHVTGAITAGYGGGDQIGLQSHTHTQGNDSHGDTEAPTSAPTPGT